MIRKCLTAAGALLTSVGALAQQGPAPAPPPPVTGSEYGVLPMDMRPHDHANDPNSLESMRAALEEKRLDRVTAAARSKLGRSRAAKPGEVAVGKAVHDSTGQLMGLIEKIEPDGAVVYNGAAAVKVPVTAFGVNKLGLLIDMTKDQFDDLVAKAQGPAKG
jgi:hypothetical protein